MFGRNNHICCAEKRIGTCCINRKLFVFGSIKIHLRALGTSYPVGLLCLYSVDIVDIVKVFQKSFGIFCDFQHPLRFYFSYNIASAAFALTADNLLVCKNDLTRGAPVYRHFLFVSEIMLEKLQEYPLRPFVVIGVRRIYFSFPVKRKSQGFKLSFEVCYVILRYDFRVNFILYGIVFRRKTESVPAHGVKNVISHKTFFSCDNIKRCIRPRMSHMKSLTRRIRKLDQSVKLRLRIIVRRMKGLVFLPYFLPFFLCFTKIIHLCQFLSLSLIIYFFGVFPKSFKAVKHS